MTHPQAYGHESQYWQDELEDKFGKYTLVETASKPRFGKGKPRPFHNVEKTLPRFQEKSRQKYSEGEKPALVLDFAKIGESKFATFVNGVFIVVEKLESEKKWEARAEFRTWKTPVFSADDPASAVTRLVNYQRWFCHRASMEWWSLGKLYRKVHFVFPFGKRKRMPAAGTFVRDFSCKHAQGWFAWNPKELTKPAPAAKKAAPVSQPLVKTVPTIEPKTSYPQFNDKKYTIVNGVLERRSNWQENGKDDEPIGMI